MHCILFFTENAYIVLKKKNKCKNFFFGCYPPVPGEERRGEERRVSVIKSSAVR
jgi:hypothetical protein